jgi:two-component system, NarL family, sensor kinase
LRTPATEAELRIGFLRLGVLVLIGLSQTVPHPNPQDEAFFVALTIVGIYAVLALVWVYVRGASTPFVFVATALDVAAVSVLAELSGGVFSQARLAYFLVPVAVAFRFRPALTAAAGVVTVAAYLIESVAHPAHSRPGADRFIAVQAGFLAWLSVAAVLLSAMLDRRTRSAVELAEVRRRLITESMTAEERERKALAEGLHDHAVQNLLSARHDLEEAAESAPAKPLERARRALDETIHELREAIFELHPYVVDQVGLAADVQAVGERAARQGGFRLDLDLSYGQRNENEALVLGAVRELLANVAQHATASNVSVRMAQRDGWLMVEVADDGKGFSPEELPAKLAEGHIGLQSQKVRIESVGGRMDVRAEANLGTTVKIRVPAG